jgi:FkbM family methyltransferase
MKLKRLLEGVNRRVSDYTYLRLNQKKLGLDSKEYRRLYAQPRFKSEETKFFGNQFWMTDAPTFLSSLREIFIEEIYKFETTKKTITILDCGANLGLASIYFKRLYPSAKIIAYEADPNICKVMQQNFSSFGYTDVEARNTAVSNTNGKLHFHLDGGHAGMVTDCIQQANIVEVEAVRLKDVLAGFSEITFLKIDIEGHESSVIPDIAQELKKVNFLFLEYHSFLDQPQKLSELLQIIKEAGFRYYIKEAYPKAWPFVHREIFLKMDLLVNIFCYRD